MSHERLLLIFEYPTLNGGERSLLAALPGVLDAGLLVEAVAPGDGPLSQALRDAGCATTPWALADERGVRRPLATLRQELTALFCRLQPALVHANSLSAARLVGPVCRDLDIPSLGHLRDIINLSGAAVADLNCHRRLLAVSQATAERHLAQGLDAHRVYVTYNGVDLTRFAPRPPTGWLHRQLGLAPATPLVGNIGQLSLRKGQDVLAQAAVDIVEAVPETHFVFLGQRFSRKEEAVRFERDLRQAFETPPLIGRGHFLGVRGDVPDILPELAVLAHVARQEPLGRVLLEASAAGLPIVATDVGGTREIVGDDPPSGQLVPADNPAALAAAVCRLLLDRRLAAAQAAQARQRIQQRFDIRDAAGELVRHYREVLQKRGDQTQAHADS